VAQARDVLPGTYEGTILAAATTPAARLVLALAAVHAARVAQIATLMLDDVDLGNRPLTIAGRARPLDDLTLKLLADWLDYRRRRWPSTANLHLLINNQPANTTSQASTTGSVLRYEDRTPPWNGSASTAARRGPDPQARPTASRRGLRAR
jgi:integrase